jgi:hypothetical protein
MFVEQQICRMATECFRTMRPEHHTPGIGPPEAQVIAG